MGHGMEIKTNFNWWVKLFVLLLFIGIANDILWANDQILPLRKGKPPRTTSNVPHVQIGIEPVPELSAELLRRVSALPGTDIRSSIISLPGAKGFWLRNDVKLAHPEVIVGGREFAHIHPDGSLHASLPPKRAKEAVNAKWAIWHPWSKQRDGWDGFVMLYTPQSIEELDVIFQLIVDSYNFVTGMNLSAKDFSR